MSSAAGAAPRALTRRDFLHWIGVCGGAAAAYQAALGLGLARPVRAVPLPPRRRLAVLGPRVLLLGAGIAALTAAYELTLRGYRCRLLEASHRAGGRNLTLRHGDLVDEIGAPQRCAFDPDPDLYFNAGAARLPGHHATVLGYCRELGVPLAPFVNDNRDAWVLDEAVNGGRRLRHRRYLADTRGFLAELCAKCVDRDHLAGTVPRAEAEAVLEMLRVFGDLGPEFRYRGSPRAGLARADYTMPPELKAVGDFSELLKSTLWRRLLQYADSEDDAALLMEPVGGMDRIVTALLRHVGHLVTTRAMVESLRRQEQGVRVVYRDASGRHELEAEYCLNGIPFHLMAGLDHDFPDDYAEVLTAVPRGRFFKLAFQMRERFWEREGIYGGISWTTQDITQIWYPSHGIHRPKGIVLGAYCFGGEAAERFERMSAPQRLAYAAAEGERLHPGYGRYVESGVSVPWHRMSHMLGCAPGWDADLQRRLFARAQAPLGRHYFIGDQVSYHPGWQEGAMQSARWAVADLERREQASPSRIPA